MLSNPPEITPRTLKRVREARGMSRADLAAAANLHTTTILRIETGKIDPRFEATWTHILRALRDNPTSTTPAPGTRAANVVKRKQSTLTTREAK